MSNYYSPLDAPLASMERDDASTNDNSNGNSSNMDIDNTESISEGTYHDLPPLIDRRQIPESDVESEGDEDEEYSFEDNNGSNDDIDDQSLNSEQVRADMDLLLGILNSHLGVVPNYEEGDDEEEEAAAEAETTAEEGAEEEGEEAEEDRGHADDYSNEYGDPYAYSDYGYDSEYNYDDDIGNDGNNDDYDPNPCTCPHCLKDRIVGSDYCWDDDETNGEEHPLYPDSSPCAICMEQETSNRKFAHLPCCGPSNPSLDPSSTRFCQKCLARCMATKGCAVPHNSSSAQLAGECPRCKKIVVLEQSDPKSGFSYKRTKVASPSTEALFWYVARNGTSDGALYRSYLLTLAVCPNPNYIPQELLLEYHDESPEHLRTLCQWGLLCKQTTTTLQKPKTQMMALKKFVDLLWKGRLWQGIASILRPRLERTKAFDWKVSKILFTAIENRRKEGSAVYYSIDPVVQSELRSLVFLYLHCFDHEEWYHPFHEYHDCDVYGHKQDSMIKLLPPLLRNPTEKELEKMNWFQEMNCRRVCALWAWKSFVSAYKAASLFRVLPSLWLANLGLSMVVLSIQHLGIPPISDWPPPLASSDAKQKGVVSWLKNTRWRWYLMSGLNLILLKLLWKLALNLLYIGWDLIVAASFCLALGKFIEIFTSKDRQLSELEKKNDKWMLLRYGHSIGCIVAALHLVWSSSPWLYSSIEGFFGQQQRQQEQEQA